MKSLAVIVVVALLVAVTITSSMKAGALTQTVSVPASSGDTEISSANATANRGSATTVTVDGDEPAGTGNDVYGLVKFPLTNVPAGVTVADVKLRLNITNSSTQAYSAFALKRAWVENQATWRIWKTGTKWQNAGAKGKNDTESTALFTITPNATGVQTYTLGSAARAKVQAWINDPTTNNGFILANSSNTDGFNFSSRETADSPALIVTYDDGTQSDTTPPETTIASGPSEGSTVTGSNVSFAFSSSEVGSSFQCSIDGALYASCTSSKSYTQLADGSHTFQVKATDAAGNTDATPAFRTWTVDTAAPNTTIDSKPAALTNSTSASFGFSSNENGSGFECKLDSGNFESCTSPQNYSNLSEGSHTFSVRATDVAGNVDATLDSYSWTVDTNAAPDTTIDSGPSGTITVDSATFAFTSSEAGATFECSLDGAAYSACTSPQSFTSLAVGQHTFSVGAMDAAGDTDATPATRTWTVEAPPPPSDTVTGALVKWQPVTITFTGPSSTETSSSPNPFLDYRLQVTFTSPSGKSIEVPGFYDGGSNWKVKFNPDESGTWSYRASFRQGANVAIDTSATAGAPTSFDGASGNFDIAARDASAPGFLSQGELEYVGEHYLKFRDGSYFLKGGADSPENWLGYAGFDNTPTARHTFSPHVQDWQSGDPAFNTSTADGGKGLIGALNYLSAQGVNSIYFLPMNIGGDGQDSSPYVSVANWAGSTANDNYHFDVSKLSQWDQAFAHAQKKGIMLHFVLNEAEAANKLELDGATLGPERKLFYREMVARFGYYNALQWNISEEYDLNLNLGSDTVKSFADYIQSIDPYDHPITVHQAADPDIAWTPFLGDSRFSTTSFQYFNSYATYGAEVEEWRQKSSSAGRPLPIAMDELTPATTTNSADMRKGVLWPTYLSGGNLEWYIGSEDQSLEDFRRYAPLWQDTNRARTFMQENLPFWQMQPADGLLSGESTNYGGGQVFAKNGDTYAVYLPNATSSGSLDLSGAPGSFEKKWFNPRSGSFEGTLQTVAGGTTLNLGAPPSTSSEDWVVLLK